MSEENLSKIVTDLGDLSMDDSKSFINSAKDSAYETEIDVYGMNLLYVIFFIKKII